MLRLILAVLLALPPGWAAAQFAPNTTLSAAALNAALAAPTITGGSINGAPIGFSNPQAAKFTTLDTTGAVNILGSALFRVGDNTALKLTSFGSYIAPTAGTLTAPFQVSGTAFGTITNATNQATMRGFLVTGDTMDAAGAQGGGVTANYFGHTVSAGATGGRTTLWSYLDVAGATAPGSGKFYTSMAAFAFGRASAGGAAGLGNARGNLFGFNASAALRTGAGQYWSQAVGTEVNVAAETGTGLLQKVGLQVVLWDYDAVQGSEADAAVVVANKLGASGTSPGWKQMFAVGVIHGGFPVASDGSVLAVNEQNRSLPAGRPLVAAHGIDFRSVPIAFSGSAFASPGWRVNGAGQHDVGPATLGWSSAGIDIGAAGRTAVLSSIASGGSGYRVGDVLRDPDGGVWIVATESAGGVATLTMHTAPALTSGAAPSNPRSLAGGMGLGATINLTWSVADRITLTGRVVTPTSATPASASASCVAGEAAWDASYLYRCVAANTWRRVAHSTW